MHAARQAEYLLSPPEICPDRPVPEPQSPKYGKQYIHITIQYLSIEGESFTRSISGTILDQYISVIEECGGVIYILYP